MKGLCTATSLTERFSPHAGLEPETARSVGPALNLMRYQGSYQNSDFLFKSKIIRD